MGRVNSILPATRTLPGEGGHILGSAVHEHVPADGHAVDWIKRLSEAADGVRTVGYDLILLDLSLPAGRGLDFYRTARGKDNGFEAVLSS